MQFNITRGGCLSPRRDLSYSTVVVECTENVLSIHLLHTYLHSIYYTVYTVYLCIHIYDLYIILLLLPIIISAAIHLHSVLIYIYLYIITCRRGRACHLLRLLQVINEWLRSQTIILSAQAPPLHPYIPTLICGGVERRRRIRLKKKNRARRTLPHQSPYRILYSTYSIICA